MRALVLSLGATALLCGPAISQFTHVVPNGFASVSGNTNGGLPWATSAVGWPGLRATCIYDATNFTGAGITAPIVIQRMRWRAAPTTISWTGGSFSRVTVQMATAAVPFDAIPMTPPGASLQSDVTVVATGPVSFAAGAGNGAGVPGPWVVDVALSTPFFYDPLLGGLAIDIDVANTGGPSWSGGTTCRLDVDETYLTRAGRWFATGNYPFANGMDSPHGVIVELTYQPATAAQFAMRTSYGQGCNDRARSYYELFPTTAAFNLGGSATVTNSIEHVLTGSSYLVRPGSGQWRTPVGTVLPLGEDAQVTIPLNFTFPYPGGSANQHSICSNGFVTAGPSNGAAAIPSPGQLVNGGPRYCVYWHDLSPVTGGQVIYDQVPGGPIWVTWNAVPTRGGGGTNTFQVMFSSNGTVEFRYRALSGQSTTHPGVLVGWSPGGGVRDPGSRPIATFLPFTTDPNESAPLRLGASRRPVLGSSIDLNVTGIPPGTAIGALIRSFTRHDPGLPLLSIGMPACFQYVGLDTTVVFLTSGPTFPFQVAIPNNPIHVGTLVHCQAATFSLGVNPLGVLASNGVELLLNSQ